MKATLDRHSFWNEAGKAGLALGGVSILYSLLTSLIANLGGSTGMAMLISVMNVLLWVAKFVGCIWLMRFFMKKLMNDYEKVNSPQALRRYGTAIALLSALIYSAFTLATLLIAGTEAINEAMAVVMNQYSSMLDSNTMAQMDSMMQNLPVITFVTNLIYCFIFGVIVSAILSKNLTSDNPFDEEND